MKLYGVVAIYNPQKSDFVNIEKYVDDLDYCYLMDDSGKDNYDVCSDFINKHLGKVEYVNNIKNIGLTASVNRGFKKCIKNGADWVLVMNPDGTFQNDAISIYKRFIQNNNTEKVAIIAPVFNIDRRPKKASVGYREIKHPDMTGCLYSTNVLKKIGLFDYKTYFYSLDVEYCLRVIKKGYKIIECSEAVLNHRPAETFEVKIFGKTILRCGKDTPVRFYYQFRTAFYIHRKYHSLYCFLYHVYKYMKVVLFFDNKLEYFSMIKKGIYDAKRGFYGNYNNRMVR
ncbi:rhamnosyltransferase [Lachnospiraceae bacterium]|nr:rhamnosyltransferase [Lachnospiraceae bacterium]